MSSRMPIDADTYLYYDFQEAAAPFADQGSAGIPMQDVVGSGTGYQAGVRGQIFGGRGIALDEGGSDAAVRADGTAAWTSSEITASAWVTIQDYFGGDPAGKIIAKAYAPTTWPAPYYGGFGLTFYSGDLEVSIVTTGPTRVTYLIPKDLWLPLDQKTLVGVTYDGANVKVWVNGIMALSTPRTGAIDIGTGPWLIGSNTGGGVSPLGLAGDAQHIGGVIEEYRICQVARDQDWWTENWERGVAAEASPPGGAMPTIIDAPNETLGALTISASASASAEIPRVNRKYDTLMLTCATADFHYRLNSDAADPATADDVKGYLGVPRLVPVDGRRRVHAIAAADAIGSHTLEFVPVQTRGG